MLQVNKEIQALLHLIDDPDEDVYQTVSERIMTLGNPVIPNLEAFWEENANPEAQERIESLIHRLQFRDLQTAFVDWVKNPELLAGVLLVSKFQYPDFDVPAILSQVEKMRRNVWLELNSFLTPMEQINVINSIIFNYYRQRGAEIDYSQPDNFLLHKAVESKKGNAISNGLLYLILCQRLDVPLKPINIPRQFIMAYMQEDADMQAPTTHSSQKIKFYVDGLNGQMYSQKDLEKYFKRINVPPLDSFYHPMDNKSTIQFLLAEYGRCFTEIGEPHKREEIMELFKLLQT